VNVCEIVKTYAGPVGFKPADFGAHSLRANNGDVVARAWKRSPRAF
jgi:hypothetical protein